MKRYLIIIAVVLAGCSKNDLTNQTGNLISATKSSPLHKLSAVGDVVGKITVGYQGWFSCVNDGSPNSSIWWHWATDNAIPSTSNYGIKAWPDMREYTTGYQTAFANLGNGQPANLFSSYADQTIATHFLWMQQNGIDAAALQRFNPNQGEGPFRDGITSKIQKAAETYGRKFYIMYDVSGWTNMQSEIKADWTNKMKAYTASTAYAKQNGMPVVCIWGICFNDASHPFSESVCLDVVNWFKSQGCYVIGGVPREWRTVEASYGPVYKALNMLSPWLIGSLGDSQTDDQFYSTYYVPDEAYCVANGIDYQPCVLPGDLSAKQRVHGDFMWHQFYNVIKAGAQGIYISMFDEYNEGNQIAKTAENAAMIPAGSTFVGLNEDGIACSSDYYLRLTGDGGKMLKGLIPLTSVRPTAPVAGGSLQHLPPVGQNVTLKGSNNLYVSSENAAIPMTCNRTSPGAWETFSVVDAGNGKIALMNQGKYVSSENGGSAITCNRTAIGPWEQFDYTLNSDGTVTLRGNNLGYISIEDGIKPMTCTRTTAGATEKFIMN